MKVLVVDDEIYAIEGIKWLIDWRKNGVEELFDASTLGEAKEILQRESIDLLLCDIELVEENGLDLLTWINEQGYPVKTVFLTCHEVFSYAHRAIREGAVDYILKPMQPEQMTALLEKVKDQKRREDINSIAEIVRKYIPEDAAQSDFLKRMDDYLMNHLDEEFNRNKVASEMYLNPDYMARLLKKETGLSFSEYVGKKRMIIARLLLQTTEMPVTDISQRVGIQEISYFFRLFKKETGMTPKTYREQFHNGDEQKDG